MSINPIEPLTVEPIVPFDDDWFDGEEDLSSGEKIARSIEQRAMVLANARRRHTTMNLFDYEVDEIIGAVYRSCAAIARGYRD